MKRKRKKKKYKESKGVAITTDEQGDKTRTNDKCMNNNDPTENHQEEEGSNSSSHNQQHEESTQHSPNETEHGKNNNLESVNNNKHGEEPQGMQHLLCQPDKVSTSIPSEIKALPGGSGNWSVPILGWKEL
ncbi:hypothetical protein K7X08_025765 [Anisodus acutangulus]|uniref:Uncharacterized protein n=1 Tax=Anisodus acutangulus TaxID=402998 RepID=A0A9Q1L8I4_9SOLA|nr:hypothetical protein K7X08_025765 [Anisodus acutangulus]